MKIKQILSVLAIHLTFTSGACDINDSCNQASALDFNVGMSSGQLLAGQSQKAYLNIDITGRPSLIKAKRPQANIAFVLDKSGSMSGHKMIQAKQALEMAVSRLNSQDIVSLVVYDDTAKVLWPAATLQSPSQFLKTVNTIYADGSTALFAGVTQGGYEVRKYLADNKVNRVVLLSDGIANVGPSEPHELAELGRAFGKQHISISTIGLGLGYNEDLMTQLAGYSDGNHYFVENADKLAKVFDSELGDVFSVVAQDIEININFKNGVKPIRILGKDDTLSGQQVVSKFNQIYGEQKRHLTLEIMVPPNAKDFQLAVADVAVKYHDVVNGIQSSHRDSVTVAFTDEAEKVEESQDSEVFANVISTQVNEVSKEVVRLRDQGDLEGATTLGRRNLELLEQEAERTDSPKLKAQIKKEQYLFDNIGSSNWNKARKQVREDQYATENQQTDSDGDQ